MFYMFLLFFDMHAIWPNFWDRDPDIRSRFVRCMAYILKIKMQNTKGGVISYLPIQKQAYFVFSANALATGDPVDIPNFLDDSFLSPSLLGRENAVKDKQTRRALWNQKWAVTYSSSERAAICSSAVSLGNLSYSMRIGWFLTCDEINNDRLGWCI